jgi:peptidoglycan/LPS O-acetylase OafA/YrhL
VRLDGLMMGAVLAVLARSSGGLERYRRLAPVVAITGAVTLLAIGIWRGIILYNDPVVSTIGFPLIALTYGALLVMIMNARAGTHLNRLFTHRFLRSWGKYSYGIYVFHFLIMGVFSWFLPMWEYEVGGSRLPAALLFAVILSAISFATAWLSYNLYEKRFLALKRFFEREPVPAASGDLLPHVGSPRMVRSAPES